MQQPLDRAALEARHDFAASRTLVLDALRAAFATREGRLRFMGRYTSWNGMFGSGVSALAGRIGRSRAMFLDPDVPVHAVADRSVYVASWFFDAARDEFDDRDTVHRDTHRCLAQAVIQGLLDYDAANGHPWGTDAANALLADPPWLVRLQHRVAEGYGARDAVDDVDGVFRAIGYHIGSEVLADQEFSNIDAELRASEPAIVTWLTDHQVTIAGQAHAAYTWIRVHSGHGGGAEADHFAWALKGVRRALKYTPPARRDAARAKVLEGFDAFAADHAEFFTQVGT